MNRKYEMSLGLSFVKAAWRGLNNSLIFTSESTVSYQAQWGGLESVICLSENEKQTVLEYTSFNL